MRPNVYRFVREVRDAHWASGLPVNTIVHEIGSYRVGNDPILRDLFPNTTYIGVDMRAGPNVDKVCDVEDYFVDPRDGLDIVLCCDTLEHVERPWKAAKRMQQALASQMGPDLLVVTVPFMFGVHSHPNDYWRFTTEGLKTLFDRAGFANFAVGQDPAEDGHPHTVVGVASNGLVQDAVREVVAHGSWRTNRRSVVPVPTHQAAMAVAFDTEEELADFEREVGPWWEARCAAKKHLSGAEKEQLSESPRDDCFESWVTVNQVMCSYRSRFDRIRERFKGVTKREEAQRILSEEGWSGRYPLLPEWLT